MIVNIKEYTGGYTLMTSNQESKPWAYDEYWGVSGQYIYDPESGRRHPVHESAAQPAIEPQDARGEILKI